MDGGLIVRKKVLTIILSAIMLIPLLSSLSVNAINEVLYGTLTITIIDEETSELFKENRDCFGINGSSIYLDGWNPSESNPHTITDVQTQLDYMVRYTAKDYDGYTYFIDTEKSDPFIVFNGESDKELTIYMKKNNWDKNNNVTEPINVIQKKNSFEELYCLEENELKQYCSDNKLNFISKEYAAEQIANNCSINIMVKPKDYLLTSDDLLESSNLTEFKRNNFEDYDFNKVVADLQFPDKYYTFNSDRQDFAYYSEWTADENSDPKRTYLKLIQVNISPNKSIENKRSLEKLYQIAAIWAEQNPEVYCVSLDSAGISSDIKEETVIKGDVNADGVFSINDVIIFKKWLLGVSGVELTNPKAADFLEDDKLNAFDLKLMKSALVDDIKADMVDNSKIN